MAALDPETGGNEAKEQDEKSPDGLRLSYHCTANNRLRVSVLAPTLPAQLKRLPVLLCCVVDTSGSMQVDALIKDASGKAESAGLSVLALVKHSIKTIVHCLDDSDYLSIVAYSSEARIITKLLPMTASNRKATLTALDALSPSGQTNLWDGLHTGLEMLRKNTTLNASTKNSAVLLFTDGLPNIVPPKGHLGMLEKYIDTHQTLPGIINTYGFGYSLDTALLCSLSVRGQGSYAFIPDSSMVGTIFVNSLANLCCTVAKNVTLKVEAKHEMFEVKVLGGYDAVSTSWGVQINLGNVMYGQNRDIIVDFTPKEPPLEKDHTIDAEEEGKEGAVGDVDTAPYSLDADALSYIWLRTSSPMKCAISCVCDDDAQVTRRHYYRLRACDELRECMGAMKLNEMDSAQKKVKAMIKDIKADKLVKGDVAVAGLLADLSGQGFESISKREYYDKWGKHYLPSLIGAHLAQLNNNFKDPGVQHYGGALFQGLRDTANDVFIKLPPPKARNVQSYGGYGGGGMGGGGGAYRSAGARNNKGGGGKKKKAAKRVDMKQFYNAGGGCFDGDSRVSMEGGVCKRVCEVVKGDVMEGGSAVVCVVRYACAGGRVALCGVGAQGLWLTEYHPVRVGGEWVFPVEIDGVRRREMSCEWVYNLVLSGEGEGGHVANVGGVECCTLGHGMKGNVVIEHAYFGTTKVVEDLRKQSGWESGCVMLKAGAVTRDAQSNLVNGIV